MPTISKRSSGTYQAQVCIRGRRLSKTFSRLSDAKRWALQIESDADDGVPYGARQTLRHYIERFHEIVKTTKHSRHKCAVLGCLLKDPLADIPICDIRPADVDAWIRRRQTIPSSSTGKIVKDSSILRQLTYISSLFAWLVRDGLIASNPCIKVKKPEDSDARERTATEEEIERLKLVARWQEGQVPTTKIQRVCAAFLLSCLTGMRSGEMMRIERSWVRGQTLTIPAEATKTATARTIALNSRAQKILEDVISLNYFPTIWDISDGSRDALWRKIRDQADLGAVYDASGRLLKESLHFHDGRATFCTWAASPGADGAPRLDVMSLARQTGHKNIKMLMRYYRPNVESFVSRLNS